MADEEMSRNERARKFLENRAAPKSAAGKRDANQGQADRRAMWRRAIQKVNAEVTPRT